MKRISARAVILEGDKLLTIFRRKINSEGVIKEYYVIPGGGKEENETLEECVLREIKEEFDIEVEILGLLGKKEYDETVEYYYHCKRIDGIPVISGEEKERMTEENYYEVRTINLKEIDKIDINAKDMIEKAINNEYV